MAIIGSLPNVLANGQTADATPLMADLNFIVNQVNANAAPLATAALTNASNSFTLPQGGVSAQTVAQFVIAQDIITGGYQTLTSTLGTNTITARSTQIIASSQVANQSVFLIPSQTNTGAATLNRDALGAITILNMGSGLRGGELVAGIPVRLFLDGSNYHLIGPSGRVVAPTAVISPLIGPTAAVNLGFQVSGGQQWILRAQDGSFTPTADLGANLGSGVFRLNSVITAGVQFSATQIASADPNKLDDYAEGTWTPSVGGSATYNLQTGTYTKIGRLVFIVGHLNINAIGTGSTTTVSGLPFACIAENTGEPLSVSDTANLSITPVSITGRVNQSATTIIFPLRTVASAADTATAFLQNSSVIHFAGCYQTT